MAVYKLSIEAVSLTDLEQSVIELARRFPSGAQGAVEPPAAAEEAPAAAERAPRRRRAAQRSEGDVQHAGGAALSAAAPAEAAGGDAAVQVPALEQALAGAEQPTDDQVEPAQEEALAQEGGAGRGDAEEAEAPQEVSIEDLKEAAKALAGQAGKGIKALHQVFLDNGVTQPNEVPAEKRPALLAALRKAVEQ